MDAGFGEALIGALAGGGVAVARHEVARLIRGCLDRLRGRGRAANELAGVLEAFTRGADEDVAKELEALPPAVRSGAAAQVDEALTDSDDDLAEAVVTRDLVNQAELIRQELTKAEVPIQVTATGPGALAAGRMAVAVDVVHGDKNVYTTGKPEVSWPVWVGQVPDVAAAHFQHRPGVDLATRFAAEDREGTVTLVLAGLGGTGKTQLAAHYARSKADLDLRVWVTASSRAGVVAAYAAAAVAVGVTAAGGGDEQGAAEAFSSWLHRTNKSWLLVLDDLVVPADLDGWWPTGQSGQVVVTTRRRDAELADHGGMIDVDVFELEEAQNYLTTRLADWQADDIAGVTADLGFLPLAVAQAASYMLHRGGGGLRCSQYRRRLADQAKKLDVVLPSDARAGGYRSQDKARATVATTWSLSIEAADTLPPLGAARAALVVGSLLDPNGIPMGLLATASGVRACKHLAEDGDRLTSEDLLDALDHLARFSLADLSTDSTGRRWVRVHALVQRAVRETLPDGDIHFLAWSAADGLKELWPREDYRVDTAEYLARLRRNVAALRHVTGSGLFHRDTGPCPFHRDTWGAHPVLFATVHSLDTQPLQAPDQARALALDCEQFLGAEHPATLAGRGLLGISYLTAGRLDEAVPLLEALLADIERLLGAEHRLALTNRGTLAAAYRVSGRLDEAVPLLEALLADSERLLGAEDPLTLTNRGTLAAAYLATRRLDEAVPLLEATSVDSERLLGAEHPETLTNRGTLAAAYLTAGRLDEAVPLLEVTLADCERVLGAEHPIVLFVRGNLAAAYHDAGRIDEAVPLFEVNLADNERLLGAEHPDTMTSRRNLATANRAAERLAR